MGIPPRVKARVSRWLVTLVFTLSVVDGISTAYCYQQRLCLEVNTLMGALLLAGVLHFFLFKLTVVSVMSAVLYRYAKHRYVFPGIVICSVLYAAVVAVHLHGYVTS